MLDKSVVMETQPINFSSHYTDITNAVKLLLVLQKHKFYYPMER